MKIFGYLEHSRMDEMSYYFINNFHSQIIKESTSENILTNLKNLQKDIKFNFGLIATFGFGVTAIYPMVESLIKNGPQSIEVNMDNVVLVSLAALSISYIESKKGNGVTRKDAKTLLEELKLRGIGNGIVKKIIKCLYSVLNIFKILFKKPVVGIIDMIGYTSLLVPTMNAVNALLGKYNLDMDTLPGNFLALGIGITTIIAKNGIDFIFNKLKSKMSISKPEIISDEVEGDLDINIDNEKHELIKDGNKI